jgi:hypothetical protein
MEYIRFCSQHSFKCIELGFLYTRKNPIYICKKVNKGKIVMEYIKPARAEFTPVIPNMHIRSMVQFKIEKLLTHRAKKFPAGIEPKGSIMCSKKSSH